VVDVVAANLAVVQLDPVPRWLPVWRPTSPSSSPEIPRWFVIYVVRYGRACPSTNPADFHRDLFCYYDTLDVTNGAYIYWVPCARAGGGGGLQFGLRCWRQNILEFRGNSGYRLKGNLAICATARNGALRGLTTQTQTARPVRESGLAQRTPAQSTGGRRRRPRPRGTGRNRGAAARTTGCYSKSVPGNK
jgi:hypothetical protein